jgi:hypothetical protein
MRLSEFRRMVRLAAKAVAFLAIGTVAVVAVLFLYGRLAPMPPGRAEALRIIQAPTPPVAGRDGTDELLTLGHAVPLAERAKVAAERREYIARRVALLDDDQDEAAAKLVDPLSRYDAYPSWSQEEDLCQTEMDGCLAFVRSRPAAVDALLRANAPQLQREAGFVGFDGVRLGRRYIGEGHWPGMTPGRRLAYTALAAQFVRSEQDAAMSATCRDLAGWRRIGADADFLVMQSVATAYVRQDLRLLAQMLLERTVEAPLPDPCATALAPTTDAELSVCESVRSEFAWRRHEMDHVRADEPEVRKRAWQIDMDQVAGGIAPLYAHYCGEPLRAAARDDRAAGIVATPHVRCGTLEKLAHLYGCALVDAADEGPMYDYWIDARTDQAEAIALVRTLLWLRSQTADASRWPALLRERPASLGLHREPAMDGARLWIRLRAKSTWKRFWVLAEPVDDEVLLRAMAKKATPAPAPK